MIFEAPKLVGILDNMFSQKFADYLYKVEGRYSSNPKDTARTCHEGIHTVLGITYCNYMITRLHLGKSQSYQSFLDMSSSEWLEIFNRLYPENVIYDGLYELNQDKPVLAMYIIDWAFNRGQYGMEVDLAKFQREKLGIVDDNITIPEILENFRTSIIPESGLLKMLYFNRIAMYKTLKQYPTFGKGWENRVRKFYRIFVDSDVLEALAKYDPELMKIKI